MTDGQGTEVGGRRTEPELGVDLSTFSTGGFERGAGSTKMQNAEMLTC